MNVTKYYTKEAVLKRAEEIIGIPLKELDTTGRLATGKGAIGTVIEESWFGYHPNSQSEPDFPEAGVELKVTPYIHCDKGVRAKERLVCNIINYMEEYDKTFQTSSFWYKCNTMLLMSYEHLYDCPKGDYKIDAVILFSFPEADLIIIENDWATIMKKVRAGKAHELTEGDTLYLAACTKGATSESVRKQPFSQIPAKQRAFSLKSTYMTQILNKYIFGDEEDERIIKDWRYLKERTFEEFIINKVSQFYGMTQDELKAFFGVESKAKNVNEILLARMLNIKGKIAYTEEFKKAGIIPKTIQMRNGIIRESMSFPSFDFIELSREKSWEESDFYNYLAPTKFLFAIFQEEAPRQYVFRRVMFWNIPSEDLDEVGKVWNRTVETIREGVVLTETPYATYNNLPKMTESPVAHVRPKGRNAADKLPLPDGRMMTKQCFWLNSNYIRKQIKKNIDIIRWFSNSSIT